MKPTKVSLDQWRALTAVIDCGGFAQAAAQLNRSQSSVSYAVRRLQELLGVQILHIDGRKAVLSDAGAILLQRSRQLLADAAAIEEQAHHLEQGWEAEIRLAVEVAYPTHLLMEVLKQFVPRGKDTRIRLQEVVLSGAEDALLNDQADLVVSPFIPQGFFGEELVRVEFIAVAHPEHALHQLGRELTPHDLNRETHVVITDSGSRGIDSGWISDSRRWAVSSPDSALKIIKNGLGYGWVPEEAYRDQLHTGLLKPLSIRKGLRHTGTLYLVYADLDQIGPATKRLADIFKRVSSEGLPVKK